MLFEFWGERACFSRPELKVERYSYDIPTPSALRGMIEAIYWHPSIVWMIDRLYVLNPIRQGMIKRNEVSKVVPCIRTTDMNSFLTGMDVTSKDVRDQRASRILIDVHYVVDAHFNFTDKAGRDDNSGKVSSIVRRRLEKGQCFSTPYLGCREFSASFRGWPDGVQIPSIDTDMDFGLMLYDLDYSNPERIKPTFFHAIMKHGVVEIGNVEVMR